MQAGSLLVGCGFGDLQLTMETVFLLLIQSVALK